MFMETSRAGSAGRTVPTRKKIWEIDQIFRCPVVGMCLDIREQRWLCRMVGAAEQAKSDFAILEMLVATMDGENPLSRKLEDLLARKYESEGRPFLGMTERAFLENWRRGLRQGTYQILLWAAAVRGPSPTATVEIFGSLHMAMHEHAKAYGRLLAAARGQDQTETSERPGLPDREHAAPQKTRGGQKNDRT
ncbi:MAG: hypothetical protein EOL86_06205 [Deltaproteobacteria bacterium]|nr:hypothetical protein [Deltaproteobacteria bacterium]